MEKATHGVRNSDQRDGARIHGEVSCEDNIRREQRDPDAGRTGAEIRIAHDNDLKLQRLYDILPKPVEQLLVLED